ncbi:MAG: type II toxin-antitoxin system RelE family toxin [Candidatus Limnocylindria bacterium]
MTHRVVLAPSVARTLGKLRGPTFVALRGTIMGLGDEPRPAGCKKLSGRDLYRIRLRIDGIPWRVVYQVRDGDRVVLITHVARRDEGT